MKIELKKTGRYSFPTGVMDIALQHDEARIIAACMGGLYGLDIPPRDNDDLKPQPYELGQHTSYVSSVGLSADSTKIYSTSYDGSFHLRELKPDTRQTIAPQLQVALHSFWSWQMVQSQDGQWCVSASGQYLAGAEDYSPLPSPEPTIKLIEANSGNLRHAWHLLPPVQCVAIDAQGKHVAAANLMGDIAVYDIASGAELAKWRTPNFTSWGIIKSHCYIGGIFAISFAPDGESLYVAGMGEMRDPMAGNGKQLWQRFAWKKNPAEKLQESHADDTGEGLMEAFEFHPSGEYFAMAGRLRGGNWNVGFFETSTGRLIGQAKTGMRITSIRFTPDGHVAFFGGMQGQPGIQNGVFPDFGYIERFAITETDSVA